MGIFFLGTIEGNILTPKLVGNSHKTPPAIYHTFFGIYFGLQGIMLVVPMAACLAVLLRFALKAYFNLNFISTFKEYKLSEQLLFDLGEKKLEWS